MIVLNAKYILPITSEIIEDGAVAINAGKIVDFGSKEEINFKYRGEKIYDLKNAILMPGFVNAHTHLELSHIKLKNYIGFPDWLLKLMKKRTIKNQIKLFRKLADLRKKKKIVQALDQLMISGTVLVGDVMNDIEALRYTIIAPIKFRIFFELIGFSAEKSEIAIEFGERLVASFSGIIREAEGQTRFKFSISPHAPYSVSEKLFKFIKQKSNGETVSVHLAEPMEEIEFLRSGSGFFKEFLIMRGSYEPEWKAPGTSSVKYLDSIGFLDEKTLAVHCVHVDDEDIEILSERKVNICTCPRSNYFLKVGKAPVRKFLDRGINLCIGTDSLASNEDLNILRELKFARKYYPDITDEELIKMVTINGAKALGFEKHTGSIEIGKDADLIYFVIPRDLKKEQVYEFILQSEICERVF